MENGKQMRFTQKELDMLKGAFKGNDALLKVLRKIFLPEIDPNAPIGQVIDLWMTVDIRNMTPETAWMTLVARNSVITHVEQMLTQIEVLANMEEATPEKVQEARKQNSTR